MIGYISFKTRILLGFSVVLTMMATMSLFSYINDVKSESALADIDSVILPHALLASDMVKNVVQVQQFLTDVSATKDPAAYEEAEQNAQAFKQGLAAFRRHVADDPDEMKQLEGLEQDFDRFYADGKRMAEAYINNGTEAGNLIMEEFDKSSLTLAARMEALRATEVNDAKVHVHELSDSAKTVTRLLLALAVLSVFTGIGIAFYLARNLSKQLGIDPLYAKGIAKEIAKGHFDREIRLEPGDSKSLLHALKEMQHQLHERMLQEQDRQQQLRAQMEREAKAKQSALRIQMALDKTSTNIMMADENHTIIYMNEAMTELFRTMQLDVRKEMPEFDVSQLIGASMDIFHRKPAHQQSMLDTMTVTLKSSFMVGGRNMDFVANPVFDEGGRRVGTVVEWKDRTHEIKIENEIKAIVDAAKSGELNRRLELSGKTGFFQTLSANINDLTAVIDSAFTDIAGIMASMAGGDLSKRITNDYEGVYGDCKNAINTMLDTLHERIENEAKAKASALRIQMALDKTSTHVMMADEKNRIIYVNEALAGLLGKAHHEIRRDIPTFDFERIIGFSLVELHKNATVLHDVRDSVKSNIEIGGLKIDFVANPVRDDQGRRIGTVVEWNDRTHEIKIENEIKAIVDAVKEGELNCRLDTGNKTGFFQTLSRNINELTEVIDSVFGDIAQVIRGMAAGDLTKRITRDYEGVYGSCKNDVNTTLDKLINVFKEVQDAAVAISQYSNEISSGNNDLSHRAEQQAASLEETASSMEELTGTVKHNADYAKQASEDANHAHKLAETGSRVSDSAVKAMQEINESNTKIGDIIGVIDEIALQTNILALNAAVEAARAGEQGRGFAVVAGEVRNLAQRSAAAAKEIKALIVDSAEKVEDGSRLVTEAGKSLKEIVVDVKHLHEIIDKIATESEEQFQGIKHINMAVAQMDDITQQNAALAEQTAAASVSMSDHSAQMRQLMAFFTLESGASATAITHYSGHQPALELPAWKSAELSGTSGLSKASAGSSVEWEEF